MLKHVKLVPFLVGVITGVIAVICIKPQQNVIFKYPNSENAGKVVYKDKNGICYKYTAKDVDCDKNEARLKDYPLNK